MALYCCLFGIHLENKRTGQPEVFSNRDKGTGEPNGYALITYEDPRAALAAVEWFHNRNVYGNLLRVYMLDAALSLSIELPGQEEARDVNEGGGSRGRVCSNASADDSSCVHVVGDTAGFFGTRDSACPMYAKLNWPKLKSCSTCPTEKPGCNGENVRNGLAGGYKDIDYEELEQVRRRRQEASFHDDGKRYDDMGNLKKKYRTKKEPAEAMQMLPDTGSRGWEIELVERNKKSDKVTVSDAHHDTPRNTYVTVLRDPRATSFNDGMRSPMHKRPLNPFASMCPARQGRPGHYKDIDLKDLVETKRCHQEARFHDNGDVYDETGYPKEKLYPEKEQDEAMQMLPDAGGKGWELKLVERDKKSDNRDTQWHPYVPVLRDPGATSFPGGMRSPMCPASRENWEDGSPGTLGSTPQYQTGTPPAWAYEAPTPGSGCIDAPSSNYNNSGTSRDSSPVYASTPKLYLPSTPAATADNGMNDKPLRFSYPPDQKPRFYRDILVNVRMPGQDPDIGTVTWVHKNGTCEVHLASSGKFVLCCPPELEPVIPKKTDRVKIISGDKRGRNGSLISVQGTRGVVFFGDTLQEEEFDMSVLCKLAF